MNRLKLLREGRGLTQADLATAAGLSRQLVGAIEAERNTPSVAAALAIAETLGMTVEAVFGPRSEDHAPALGPPVPDGAPVVAARVGDRLVYAELPDGGAAGPYWGGADGAVAGGRFVSFGDLEPAGTVVAGCDPALGLIADLLPMRGPRRLVPIQASSGAAAAALARGRLHAAVVHGLADRVAAAPEGVRRMRIARWEVGVAARRGTTIDLAAAGRGEVTLARREPGAESQRAFERALARLGHPTGPSGPLSPAAGPATPSRPAGPVASGHLEAARLVAYGAADLGLTMAPAAHAFRLDFVALEEHLVELWVAGRWWDHPGAHSVGEVVASAAFRRRVAPLGGYDLSHAGTIVGG